MGVTGESTDLGLCGRLPSGEFNNDDHRERIRNTGGDSIVVHDNQILSYGRKERRMPLL